MLDHTSSSSSTLCLKTSTPATSWARVCDTCRSAPSSLYCRPDAAFLCTGCDARIHSSNVKHERVWVCEACEQAPAAFICKADAASLCATCDKDIHSANPLARRHHRVPVMPILMYGTMAVGGVESQQSGFMSNDGEDEDESEAASWLLFDGPPVPVKNSNKESGFLYGEAGGATEEEYMEFMEFGGGEDDEQQQQQQCCYTKKMYSGGDADSVVPTQHHHDFQNHKFRLGMEFDNSNAAGYNGYPPPTTHSVSMSSLDVGVVPESTRSEGSLSHPRPSKGTIDLFSNSPVQVATQLTPMDREARVLRYRQKKKTRKFEKTIRYASRKAYAETRPRIKGRFAKRTNADVDVDQMFPTNHMIEGGYGIVPSF